MRAALDSVLAVGILHQIFDASNNNGGLVDSLLDGVDAGNMTQLAAAILTVLIAAWLLWRRPGHSPDAAYLVPSGALISGWANEGHRSDDEHGPPAGLDGSFRTKPVPSPRPCEAGAAVCAGV